MVDRRRSFLKFHLLLKQVCSELHVRDSLFSFAAAFSGEIWSRAETLAISEEVSALINTSNVHHEKQKVNENYFENGNFHCCPDASVV